MSKKPIALKNIFPQTLLQDTSNTFPDSDIAVMMVDIEKVDKMARGPDQDLLLDSLSIEEQQTYHSFSFAKRKNEWLAGRLCAKMAATDLLKKTDTPLPFLHQIIINNSDSGRPFLLWPENKHYDLSISHSSKYAIALTSSTFCGIDIQEPRTTLIRVKEKFCTDKEENLLKNQINRSNSLKNLTLLWAAKEAARKACSHVHIPGFHQLRLYSLKKCKEGCWCFSFNHEEMHPSVICGLHQDYGIAICILRKF